MVRIRYGAGDRLTSTAGMFKMYELPSVTHVGAHICLPPVDAETDALVPAAARFTRQSGKCSVEPKPHPKDKVMMCLRCQDGVGAGAGW